MGKQKHLFLLDIGGRGCVSFRRGRRFFRLNGSYRGIGVNEKVRVGTADQLVGNRIPAGIVEGGGGESPDKYAAF